MTVVETPRFVRQAASLLTGSEIAELIAFVAANPDHGDIVRGTGGIRKLRWFAKGKGKRSGVRVIYYYHSELLPLFLLNVFSKSEKVDLTGAERNELKKLIPRLVTGYQRRTEK